MGIIDDYLKSDDSAKPMPEKAAGLIEQYLNEGEKPTGRIYVSPAKPPISGVSKERSDEINSQPLQMGGYNPRDSVLQVPWKAVKAVGNAIGEGGLEAGQGVGDVFSGKPATGLGKIGTGLAQIVTSPSEGFKQLAGDVTGSPDIADRAGLASGFLPVASTFKGVTSLSTKNKAFQKLVEDIGPENAGRIAKEMRNNPNLSPADLSDSVRMGTQRLYANVEGPHVNYLGDVTRQRLDSAASDLEKHMNANLGNVVNPAEKLAELKKNIKEVGAKEINPVVKATKPVDLTDTIAHIDSQLKPGISSVIKSGQLPLTDEAKKEIAKLRKLITDDKSVAVNPEALHYLQSYMRVEADNLIKHGGQDARAGYALHGVRQKIIDAIDKASPQVEGKGTYRPALEKYRDEYHIQDSFEYGHDAIMKNGKKLEDHPSFFEKNIKDASPEELQAAKEGARIAYDTQMNAFKHAARRGTDIGDVEFNMRRMTALFGKEEAEKMSKVFSDAKKVADTNNKLVQGSQSRIQNAQNTYFEPYNPQKKDKTLSHALSVALPIAGEVGSTFLGAPQGLGAVATAIGLGAVKGGAHLASKAKTATIKSLENERNLSYSKYALPTQGPQREELIKALETVAQSNTPKLSIRQKASLARLVAP